MQATRPVPPDRMADLLRGMPKAELHIHIEGSLEPEALFALAAKNGRPVAFADPGALRRAYDFDGLQSFLDLYHAGTRALATRDDFFDMADAYLRRAAADGVVHAEIFFDTQTHRAHGIPAEDVLLGLHRACELAPERHGISAGLILCFLRHLPEADAFEALEEASAHLDKILAVGLASSEAGHPPSKFARVFARARSLGLRAVAHAGEEGPPSYVTEALDALRVDRVDHGVRSMEDPSLIARLARERVPLTVCPLSNVRLKVFGSMAEHPLRRMLEAGLAASAHSDDPAYFGGYIHENLVQAFAALGMDSAHAKALSINGIQASFLDASRKAACIEAAESFFEDFR